MNPSILSAIARLSAADYQVSGQCVSPNADAATLQEIHRLVLIQRERMDIARTAACFALLFWHHEWLQHCTVAFLRELLPAGDTFAAYPECTLRVTGMQARTDTVLPATLRTAAGAFHPQAATALLTSELNSYGSASDLAAPFLAQGECGRVKVSLSRHAIAPALASGQPLAGLDIARCWWPEHEVLRAIARGPLASEAASLSTTSH